MDEVAGLNAEILARLSELTVRHFSQLAVNERHELVQRRAICIISGLEQRGDLGIRGPVGSHEALCAAGWDIVKSGAASSLRTDAGD